MFEPNWTSYMITYITLELSFKYMLVCRTIQGPQACNLERATYMLAEKFKWGGPGSKLAHTYQLCITILHHFAWEHYFLLTGSPDPDDDDEQVDVNNESGGIEVDECSRRSPEGLGK
ncbi:hypothetical protein L208DRAFT_1375281 [Tricholoma matsutake]|nr:hypothetical protein L208DRAFT_1375281 [Tricholoma matsutake 945]